MRARILSVALLLAALPLSAREGTAQNGPAKKGVSLSELSELAKARAAKMSVQAEKQLAPYLEILCQRHDQNQIKVDATIASVVALGDSVVPLLLRKLEPRRESPRYKNLAANAARALAKMNPTTFVEPLIRIAEGESYTGISYAIPLLGRTESRRAGDRLTKLLDREGIDQRQRKLIVQSLTQLSHPGAALKVARQLPLSNRIDDRAAADYLRRVKVAAIGPQVVRALREAKLGSQIMRYIRVLHACCPKNPTVAHALLPFFDSDKLETDEKGDLCRYLAVVSQAGDEKTISRLIGLIDESATGALQLKAAMTLRDLGNKKGPDLLKKRLSSLTGSAKGKKDWLNWYHRGEYLLEFGDAKGAATTYKRAIENTKNSSFRDMLHLQIAKAQARRKKWREVRDALRSSRKSKDQIMQAASQDSFLAKALTTPSVKKFLDSFSN